MAVQGEVQPSLHQVTHLMMLTGMACYARTYQRSLGVLSNLTQIFSMLIRGIAASSLYGVAKAATIISIKVVGIRHDGEVCATTYDIIQAFEYIIAEYKRNRRKSVVSMSLGFGEVVPSLNAIIKDVAAGNGGKDASSTLPGCVEEAITVGASNISDKRAAFSNYGPTVDLFAPGVEILSTSNDGAISEACDRDIHGAYRGLITESAPHVAGLVANILSKEGQMSPLEMSSRLKAMAVKDMLLLNLRKI
ncbi:hypothetical protein H0H92_003389 [Tricholoma furcatifolium]|nr:hypothetical protein H0H92_003389 [Tricholoma furcatifolium]